MLGQLRRAAPPPAAARHPQRRFSRGLRVFETVAAYRDYRGALPTGTDVGLVATMGYLHDGHISLARAARRENDVVVATIFVNPAQFAAHEDLDTYPQNTEGDLAMLEAAGVDAVLVPSRGDIYSPGHTIVVDPGPAFETLAEGKARGGHFFRGVGTVVAKLFNITQPTRAYFGQKDAMQCGLIRKLVRELNFPTEVVVVPTQREADGLAMSSRNVYLSPEERAAAPTLYRALSAIETQYTAAGGEPVAAQELVRAAMQVLETEPLFSEVDYVSIASGDSFEELHTVEPNKGADGVVAVVSAAVQIGQTRLIDNIVLA